MSEPPSSQRIHAWMDEAYPVPEDWPNEHDRPFRFTRQSMEAAFMAGWSAARSGPDAVDPQPQHQHQPKPPVPSAAPLARIESAHVERLARHLCRHAFDIDPDAPGGVLQMKHLRMQARQHMLMAREMAAIEDERRRPGTEAA